MGLPKLNQPLFEIEIPSTAKKVKYRPFTVKEEKIMLIAQETKDLDQITLAIKQVLTNCIVDKINIDDLAVFDLEYLLINVRAQSVNNEFNFKIKDPSTDEDIELSIDIKDIKVKFDENHTNKVKLDENSVLIMKYPKAGQLKKIISVSQNNSAEELFDVMTSCFDMLAVGEEIYKFSEYTQDEINEFTEDLSSSNIQEVKKFFDTMPSMYYEKKYKNSKGEEKTFVVRGTETFFI